MTYCEACRLEVKVKEYRPKQGKPVYLLCKKCTKHFKERTFSPLEWYRLIALHGKDADGINENFYYFNGISIYPLAKRSFLSEDQIPSLQQVEADVDKLIDYCNFPYTYETHLEKISLLSKLATEKLDPNLILKNEVLLTLLLDADSKLLTKLLPLEEAKAWVRRNWTEMTLLSLDTLVKLSLTLLPNTEVLALLKPQLAENRWRAKVLKYFPVEMAVQWIETNIVPPYTPWGNLVAEFNVPWPTLEKWIIQGRPMSLVAISILRVIINKDSQIKLSNPASIEHMSSIVNEYNNNDSSITSPLSLSWGDWNYMSNKIVNESIVDEPKAKNIYYLDPFIGKQDKLTHLRSLVIKKFIKNPNTNRLISKFGGQPDWIEDPQWPLSKSTQRPMTFIGQILIDPDLFEFTTAKVAYIFISEFADEFVDGTYDYFGNENAVILQPGIVNLKDSAELREGETISKISYIPETELIDEPDFIPQRAISSLLSKADEKKHIKNIFVDKIGGTPYFLQNEEYPGGEDKWNLLLQISKFPKGVEVNLGDQGTAYVFLSSNGKKAVFGFQS